MKKLLSLFLFSLTITYSQQTINIPDDGWRLWPDTSAEWQNDKLYLPDEVDIPSMKVNPPTGGWDVLNINKGIDVTLPATVEQYYWGEFGFRPYTPDEYYFGRGDDQVKNGNYLGVSWWWKEIDIPADFKNKIVILNIRGARLRAEVYLNKQLVGYNIISEVSFDCDLTNAIKPGEKNLLAIRITNPGGRLDWLDTQLMEWGEYKFHKSHGFGGIDKGITINAHPPVYIDDFWVANTHKTNIVKPNISIINKTDKTVEGSLYLELYKKEKPKKVLKTLNRKFKALANGGSNMVLGFNYPEAKLWNLDNPELYLLKAKLVYDNYKDENETVFGFRWFEADGVGDNAVLRLNKKRIRLVSAISWGFWGYNGLFPTPELALKEVNAAKTVGMNCIQFHRNVGKTEVFTAMDEIGLLRFMEPGGGQTALGEKYDLYADSPDSTVDVSGIGVDSLTFAEKYMEEKILRMIHDHRSHPSLIIYNIQNEINPDLRNPRIFNLIKKIHSADPTRIITLKSGIPPVNQVWMKPYDNTFYHDSGKGYSGWFDQHTVGGPGIWQDEMYKTPEDFTHRSENKKEIVAWGEMLGAAVPDNHPVMIKQIEANNGNSYDLLDHKEINDAYSNFLDKWKFRNAFPKNEDLFTDIGNKCYDFWGRVIETAKLSDENDFLVISGWESTAIENHSGLLDNLRNFKGNPDLISKRFKSLNPIIRVRKLVVEKDSKLTFGLFLINETNNPHPKKIRLSILNPEGKILEEDYFDIPEYQTDKFSYLIKDSLTTPSLIEEGYYKLVASLEGNDKAVSEEKILVVNTKVKNENLPEKIAVLTGNPEYTKALKNLFPDSQVEEYNPDKNYDVLVSSSRLLYGWRSEVDSTTEIEGTEDDVLFHTESWGYWNNLEYIFTNLPPGKAKVTLRFAEVTLSKEGSRVMNVAINGDTVLNDFDIFKYADGKNIAIDTIIHIDAPDGIIKITVPKLTKNYAKFSAFKIEIGDTIIAVNAGGLKPYADKEGLTWKIYSAPVNLNKEILAKVNEGKMNLLALPEGEDATLSYSKILGDAGAYKHLGHVGKTRASWMGSWFFNKEHSVFSGLPVNQAMKSYYQVPVQNTDGILLDGNNVDVFIGYGRDHDRNIGAGGFSVNYGKGKILFFTLPGMLSGLTDGTNSIQPVVLKKILTNSMNFLK